MTDDSTRSPSRFRTGFLAGGRILVDLLIVSLWVLFLTLFFLETGWPGWVFYAVLLLGVALYVSVTARWL